MRAFAAAGLLMLATCSQPSAQGTPSPTPSPTAAAAACRLPVWWSEATPTSANIHAAFVSVPSGTVTDVGVIPQLAPSTITGLATLQVLGATFDSGSKRWLHVDGSVLTPDHKRFAYWLYGPSNQGEIHVVDIATGVDRTVYTGSTYFIIIGFAPDAIYLVHAINPRQGAFEKLYRLDPAGGTPTLVTGSDRHMYQFGWVLISDGAAWGVDFRVQGTTYIYSLMRLDLATGQATQWLESTPDDLVWPQGTDGLHRVYVADSQQQLWRLAQPGQAETLPNPGPVSASGGLGNQRVFVSESTGEWFAGRGSVWWYPETGQPKQFNVPSPNGDVYPAGPCT